MKAAFQEKFTIIIALLAAVFVIDCSPVLAENPVSLSDRELLEKKQQARLYRRQGIEKQMEGELIEAMNLYTSAIELDPDYAEVYCDLGIVYESYGVQEKAEKMYLTALEIDPNCLNAYSNLASLYEDKQDFQKAIDYWGRRAELGQPDDLWTEKAKERLSVLLGRTSGIKKDYGVEIKSGRSAIETRETERLRGEIRSLKQRLASVTSEKEAVIAVKDKEINLGNKVIEALREEITTLTEERRETQTAKEGELTAKDQEISAMDEELVYLRRELFLMDGEKERKQVIANKEEDISIQIRRLDELLTSLKQDFSSLAQDNTTPKTP